MRSTPAWWVICLVVFSLLYLATCQRGVSWQDSGNFQWRVLTGDYHGDLGLALAHPLYIAAGRAVTAIPVGPWAARLNFFSGLGMAVALANVMAVATLLTGKRWIGVAVAAMLSVCHTVWWLSTIAEVYTWSVAGLTGEIWLLVMLIRRPRRGVLAGLALVNGLGWCVHNFSLLPLPVYATVAIVLVARRRLPAWSLAAAVGAFCLGAGVYLAMIAHQAAATDDLFGAIQSALVGNFGTKVLNVSAVSKHAKENAALMAINFVSLLGPLAIVGWVRLRRRLGPALASAIGAITVIHVLFVARYNVPDQFTFLLPTLVTVALAAAVGLAELAERSRGWLNASMVACGLSVALAPVILAWAPALADQAGVDLPERQRFRDEVRYWLIPWKHDENSAERFALAALRQAAPGGVILTDSTADEAIRVVQRLGDLSSGVAVCLPREGIPAYDDDPGAFRAALGGRRLYLSRPPTGKLAEDAEFDKPADHQALYRHTAWRAKASL